MKCPKCESCEYEQYCGATEIMRKCERHNKKVEMTNEEWLRTLPADEQIKEILSRGFMTEERTAEEFVKWLKEKHREE